MFCKLYRLRGDCILDRGLQAVGCDVELLRQMMSDDSKQGYRESG